MNRRQFVHSLLGAGTLAGGLSLVARRLAELVYPYRTLEDALAAARFEPRDPESFTVVWAADVHYGIGDAEQILPPLIREVNAMVPLPAFFGIAGDLILKGSLRYGQVPGRRQKQEAIDQFKLLRRHLEQVDPRIPVKLALGNHDTYAGEGEPALFHAVFPEAPAYHAFAVKGVPFIFLNGGNSGRIDPAQLAWFQTQVRKNHSPGNTLVTVVHQPALGKVVVERGIPAAIRAALADSRGELWMLCGHIHRNQDSCFRLPRTVLTQAAITAGNPSTWGSGHPGYWIYGFRKGRVVTRIFRRRGFGFAIAPAPPLQAARAIPLPFEGHDNILWKVLVGEGDKPYLVEAEAAWCENYWHYNHHLVYKFPLALAQGRARRFALLETASGKQPRKYFASADARAWEPIPTVDRDGSYTSFPIPQACLAAATLAVRVEGCAVSGFALTT